MNCSVVKNWKWKESQENRAGIEAIRCNWQPLLPSSLHPSPLVQSHVCSTRNSAWQNNALVPSWDWLHECPCEKRWWRRKWCWCWLGYQEDSDVVCCPRWAPSHKPSFLQWLSFGFRPPQHTGLTGTLLPSAYLLYVYSFLDWKIGSVFVLVCKPRTVLDDRLFLSS